jgi:L-seryl-tRNA(Ser) seleniumtransferase
MIATSHDALRERAQRYLEALPESAVQVAPSIAYVGGGSLPQTSIASLAIVVRAASPERAAARLRRNDPAIVARVEDGRVLLDLRTIAPDEDAAVISALRLI